MIVPWTGLAKRTVNVPRASAAEIVAHLIMVERSVVGSADRVTQHRPQRLSRLKKLHLPLALVEAPDGIGYILKPGDTLGDGRLLEIGSDSVVFLVAPKTGAPSNRVVLRLATN